MLLIARVSVLCEYMVAETRRLCRVSRLERTGQCWRLREIPAQQIVYVVREERAVAAGLSARRR